MTQANSRLSVNNVFPTLEPIVYISSKDDIARLDLENAGFNSRNYAVTNGGVFENNNIFTQGKLATPLKDGYVFNGWSDGQNIDNNNLQKNHTYYAKWTEKTEPTISFKDDFKLDKTYDGQAVSISENDYTLPDDLVIGKGKTLATVTLPNGFTWVDETATADELGTHEFEAVYTPEDTTNYETVEVMIPVEVVPNTSQVNHAPEIEVSDKTLTVGDAFDPMENVIVKDKEDSTNDLVVDVTHNVNTSKAGVYEVTYKVTDSNGATVTKTITVTVKEKEAGTLTPPEKPDDSNKPDNTTKPDNPEKPDNTMKPDNTAKPGNQTKPSKTDAPKTGDMANFGVFASMLAGSSGALAVLWKKRRKDNEND